MIKSIINGISTLMDIMEPLLVKVLSSINTLGGACLTIVGLYTFYRTFISRKIKFLGIGFSSSMWDGYSFSVNIQNYSLSALSIGKIKLVVDEEYEVIVRNYQDPLLLEPLKTVKVESIKYSESLFYDSYVLDRPIKLMVYCSDGKILTVKYKKPKKHSKRHKEYKHKFITQHYYGGVLLTKSVKYVVHIFSSEGDKTRTFMNDAGMIKDPIKGFNALSRELIDDKESIVKALEELLGDSYKVILEDISLSPEFEEELEK